MSRLDRPTGSFRGAAAGRWGLLAGLSAGVALVAALACGGASTPATPTPDMRPRDPSSLEIPTFDDDWINEEADGLRLVLELPETPSAPNEWSVVTLSLVNERDKVVRVAGTTCSPLFSLSIMEDAPEPASSIGELLEREVYSWHERWSEREFGGRIHSCEDEQYKIAPGERLGEEVEYILPRADTFRMAAMVNMAEGESLSEGIEIPLTIATDVTAIGE